MWPLSRDYSWSSSSDQLTVYPDPKIQSLKQAIFSPINNFPYKENLAPDEGPQTNQRTCGMDVISPGAKQSEAVKQHIHTELTHFSPYFALLQMCNGHHHASLWINTVNHSALLLLMHPLQYARFCLLLLERLLWRAKAINVNMLDQEIIN